MSAPAKLALPVSGLRQEAAVLRAVKLLAGLAGGIAFAAGAGLVIFAATIAHYTPVRLGTSDADAIVVLTGGGHRVSEAVQLFSSGKARRLLISGANKSTTREDLKRQAGINPMLFECCIDVGYEALDTIGNADEARAWAKTWGFRRLVVVTSNYHMPRSLAEFARAMPDTELIAYPVVSRTYRAQTWWLYPGTVRIVLSEYLKFLPSAARLVTSRLMPPGETAAALMSEEPARPVAPSLMRSLSTTAARLTKF